MIHSLIPAGLAPRNRCRIGFLCSISPCPIHFFWAYAPYRVTASPARESFSPLDDTPWLPHRRAIPRPIAVMPCQHHTTIPDIRPMSALVGPVVRFELQSNRMLTELRVSPIGTRYARSSSLLRGGPSHPGDHYPRH